MNHNRNYLATYAASLVLLLGASPAQAQVSPNLGTAATYTVLATNAVPTVATVTCTDTGPGTAINGNVGSTFNSITNTACTITGAIDAPVSGAVATAFSSAYSGIDAQNPCTGTIPTVTTTLTPGVYCSAAGTTIGAGVILTLTGNASDVWVFRVGTGGVGALTLTSAQVVMGGAALACNVFWKTAQAATLTDTAFVGTVLSGTAVTMTRGSWFGRAYATTDATITDPAPLTFAGCSAPATITVRKDFLPNSTATVPVALTCTSGTVTTAPATMSEAVPAVFRVGGAVLGATCTATETAPANYTANQASCAGVALNGSCTITNTLATSEPPGTPPTTQPAGCPTLGINPVTLPNAQVGVAYSQQISANSGTAPYFYSVPANLLPAGLTLSASGVLAGTPTSSLAQTFSIRATDANACFIERQYTFLFGVAVPTMPEVLGIFLALGLTAIGYYRLRRGTARG